MIKKFLKEVISLIVGKQGEEIVDFLFGKDHVNEFLIAKKLEITINQTRNILYKISDRGLVSYIRKKDKRKGWYTYFWKIEILKSLEFLKETLFKRIEQTNNQINSRETKTFYICKRCSIEYNEENALLHDFICTECGGVLDVKDNTKSVKALKRSSDELRKELNLVDEEIKIEREKIDKKRTRQIKREEKVKSIERAEKRAARKKANARELAKNPKAVKKAAKKKTKKKASVSTLSAGRKKKTVKKKITSKKTKKKKNG